LFFFSFLDLPKSFLGVVDGGDMHLERGAVRATILAHFTGVRLHLLVHHLQAQLLE
jgi:hypothetical protein